MHSPRYKDLEIWKLAMILCVEVYRLLKLLPKSETFGLIDQLRRSSVSVPSNIAEGCGRGSRKDFNHHLYISRGSLNEVETQLILCNMLDYLSEDETASVFSQIENLGKKLNSFIAYNKNHS